jgi:hypothetical protein
MVLVFTRSAEKQTMALWRPGGRKIGSVELQPHHLESRTRHSIHGEPRPAFVALEIATYGDGPGFYLLHICANGRGTDTFHKTLDEAIDQEEIEFGVKRDEWQNGTGQTFQSTL